MKRCFVVFFVSFYFVSNTWAESLSEVYALALQNDYKLKAAESAYLADQEIKNIARSGLLPRLSAEVNRTYSETTTELESSNPFVVKNTNTQSNNGPGYSISLTQPLIDVAAFYNYKRSEFSGRLASLQLERAKMSLIFRTADAYLQTLKAGARLDAAQSAEEAYRLQLKAANIKYDAGLVRVSDTLEAQARNDSAVADSMVARNNLNISFDFLKIITGQEHTELAALPENFVVNPPLPLEFKPWLDAAEKNNIEINLAKLKANEAYKNYQAKASEHLPTLRGSVSYSDSYDDRKYNNALPDKLYREGLSAAITLSVPLYSGGSVSASAREANYRYFELRDVSNNTNREIMQATHSIYLSVVAGATVVNARKAAIKSSQSALTYAQKGYEEGVRSILDVLDAQNILYQANQNYSDALYEYLIAGLKLKEVSGLLSSKDIEELSLQLDKQSKIYLPSIH